MADQGRMEDSYEEQISAIRAIAETTRTEVAVMREVLSRLDKSLFGNGRPGVITELHQKHEDLDKRMDSIEKLMVKYGAIAVTLIAVLQFLSGSGWLSLHALTGGR